MTLIHRRTSALLLALATLSGAGSLALGHEPGHDPRPGRGGPLERSLSALDLTAEQEERLAVLRRQHHEAAEALRPRLRALDEALEALWLADPLDADAIRARTAERARLRAEMEALHVEHRLGLLALLTPEQRRELPPPPPFPPPPPRDGRRPGDF